MSHATLSARLPTTIIALCISVLMQTVAYGQDSQQAAGISIGQSQEEDAQPASEEALSATAQPRAESRPRYEYSTLGDPLVEGVPIKSELVSEYEGTYWYDLAKPVGWLQVVQQIPGDRVASNKTVPCTAWLVAKDVVLTAWHCMPGLLKDDRDLGYEWVDASVTFLHDETSNRPERYTVSGVLESDPALDYALLTLAIKDGQTAPGDKYGIIRVLKSRLDGDRSYLNGGTRKRPRYIIHHPHGFFKMILKDATCREFVSQPESHFMLHQCDTRGGSSGAPVLAFQRTEEGKILDQIAVGLHVRGIDGGLSSSAQYNRAIRIDKIVAKSRLLRSIACEVDGFNQEDVFCPDIYFPRPEVIYFERDSSELGTYARFKLDLFVRALNEQNFFERNDLGRYEHCPLEIFGHVEQQDGLSSLYANGLSLRLAQTVRTYLAGKGVPQDMMTVEYRGIEEPVTSSAIPWRNLLNRRVEVFVSRISC